MTHTQNTPKRPRRKKFHRLDLDTLWREFQWAHGYGAFNHPAFAEHLRNLTTEPERVEEELVFCNDCSTPVHNDPESDDETVVAVQGGDVYVCTRSCIAYYSACTNCDEQRRGMVSDIHGALICDGCREDSWSHCEECDAYYPDNEIDNHRHGKCDCEPKGKTFSIRNDGDELLANDTRVTVTLPAGVISEEGMYAIGNYLRTLHPYYSPYDAAYDETRDKERIDYWALSQRLEELGELWQTKQGNFTKRLSRFAYKEYGIKLPPAVVSQVGCIARDHSTSINFDIEVTRELNLPASAFAHEESCWWQSYSASRCLLKTNGGFGLRTFNENGYVQGRAWVMPLRQEEVGQRKRLTPTFDTREPDAFMVFNGYGDLSGYAPARLLSHMAGMTYRKVSFECDPMYVNNEAGYLVAREEIAERYTDGSVNLVVNIHSDLFDREAQQGLFDIASITTTERVLTNA